MVGNPGSPGVENPELQPQPSEIAPTPVAETADFSRQVEMYKANLQQKFGQKALETSVSVMALVANVPGLKDASSFIRGARAILGTASAGMLGGDLGRQLGLSKFSAEQGKRVQDFLEKTKQFFHEDGTSKALTDDERLAAEELRAEMTKQLEVSAAVAKTTEHHKLFGRMIEEELDQSATESKGWGKETLKSMASGVRSILQTDIGAKAKALATALGRPETRAAVGANTLAVLRAGKRNWKSLAVMGGTLGAVWLAPAMAPVIMTATTSVNLWRKGSQLRELYQAKDEAKERVTAYQAFSLERVHGVNQLAEQILKLDQAMGRASDGQTIEALLATVLQDVNKDTYRDIAKAVKQASARGAGLGIAAGAAMYGMMGHHQEEPVPGQQPSYGYGGPPESPAPMTQGSHELRPSGTSFIHQEPDAVYGKPPIPVEERPSKVEFNPDAAAGGTNNPMQPTQEQSTETWRGGESGTIPETVKVGDRLHLDINGDGSTETKGIIQETYKVKLDAGGRKYIAMPYMDTNGDGKFDVLKPSAQEVAAGIKQKYVKVFVDRAASGGGYLGQEIHLMADGKEVAKDTLWVGDKDQWMRDKVGTDTWNTVRERIKSSVGLDNHETKGWGFVARRGPLASLESAPINLEGLEGSAREAAIRSLVPEIQITNYDAMAKTYSGNWLGGRGFVAEFVNTKTLPQLELDALTKGWAADQAFLLKDTALGVDATAFEFRHFSVASEKLRSFSKALLFSPSGLPTHLKETLRAIHENKQVASDALFDALKASKKREFTLDDLRTLAKAAKQAIATRKG